MAARKDLPSKTVMRTLGTLKVLELDGTSTRVASLWKDRATALVFLRHYG